MGSISCAFALTYNGAVCQSVSIKTEGHKLGLCRNPVVMPGIAYHAREKQHCSFPVGVSAPLPVVRRKAHTNDVAMNINNMVQ